jgi:hypothetical protein
MRQRAIFDITVVRGVPKSNFSWRKMNLRYAAESWGSARRESRGRPTTGPRYNVRWIRA